MNQKHGAADLLHGVEIVEVLRNDHAEMPSNLLHAEKSSDFVFRNFFDGQERADENDAAWVEFCSQQAGWPSAYWLSEHNYLLLSEAKPSTVQIFAGMLVDRLRTCTYFLVGGVHFDFSLMIFDHLVFINLVWKDAVTWIFHGEHRGVGGYLQFLDKLALFFNVWAVAVEKQDEPLIFVPIFGLWIISEQAWYLILDLAAVV